MKNSSFDIKHQSVQIESKIVVALEKISEAFRVLLWQESKGNNLSPIQIQILIFLLFHSNEKCKISYLANEFNMTKATISDSVKLLLKKDLMKKDYDTIDARSFTISLTKEGKKVAQKSSSFAGIIEKSIHQFSEKQKETVLVSLLELIEKLNKEGIISIQRMCSTCRFYNKNKTIHYCNLLNKPLLNNELRVDCPEHQMAS